MIGRRFHYAGEGVTRERCERCLGAAGDDGGGQHTAGRMRGAIDRRTVGARVGTVGHRARIVPLVHGSRAVRVAAHRGRGRPGELGRLQQGQEEDRELHGWKKDWQLRRVNEGRADLELTAGEGADGAVSPNSLRSSGFRGGVSSLKFAIRAIGEVPRLPRRTAGADVHRDRDGAWRGALALTGRRERKRH